jgi:diguanylate cyclase (GGDEF)-like protein
VTVARGDVPAPRGGDPRGLRDFARAWAQAVDGTSYVPLTHVEIEALLFGLAERLAAALRGEPGSATLGYEIGAEFAAAGFDSPEGLGRTVGVIYDRLLPDAGLTGEGPRHCLSSLLETLIAGYSRAVRDRTLGEQEEIRRAALVARAQAQQALLASEARFRYEAMHDPLSGLPNRAMFAERLDKIFSGSERSTRVGVCFVDLDGFKAVNDSFGHHVGDRMLVAVAERLGGMAAESGHLIARLGGDEFVILIENTTCADDVVKVADRALRALAEPILIDGRRLSTSASIGIVERPVAGTDPADLMRAADITLYWAKSNGKARWELFDPRRNAHEVARYKLSAALPTALSRDEFVLHYQPLVGLADESLRGMEALARWRHPKHGTLTPDRFIDLAEDTGLIVSLGGRLLELACREAVRWLGLTPAAPFVSVNLSVWQIRHSGLVGDVAAVLHRTGLPPRQLQLEITESAAMGTDAETLQTLHGLADLGVGLAIDDFGTGYSNLAYLRALPVQGLKLAGSFVQGLRSPDTADPTDEAILTTLVSLGRTLGLTITAEGIETAIQARRLRAIGCDLGQGWHFGRPRPDHRVTRLITDRRRWSVPGVRPSEDARELRHVEARPSDPMAKTPRGWRA